MDAELKEYLDVFAQRISREMDDRFKEIDDRFTSFAQHIFREMDDRFTSFAQHILHEMDMRFTAVDKRLESIDSRLKLQAGLIQSGARAIARLSEYSESSESRYVDLLAKFDNLERRVMKLEAPRQQ
jgi:septation ring formation regulator EzrA